MTAEIKINLGKKSEFLFLLSLLIALSGCEKYHDPSPSTKPAQIRNASLVSMYGGEGGRQYTDSREITTANIHKLKPLWSYHTGEISRGSEKITSSTSFEATPILVEGILYLCTPLNRVVALDPATGAEFWSHDPKVDLQGSYANNLVCRGVSFWRDPQMTGDQHCAARIFNNTNDTRLIALDAKTGKPCTDFGNNGEVNTAIGPGDTAYVGEYQHTSPPAIIGNKVVIGGSVSDGSGIDAPSGVVRAFDARSGELVWAQDMAPPGYDYASHGVSDRGYALATPNVWAPMIADEQLNLVYAPTGNPLPDYFREYNGESQPERAHYGSSLVAMNGDTGEIEWHYQFVHRDFWDFDTPAQPTLFELQRDGKTIPAVAQGTKMGFIFILDRRNGEPLFPIEERLVPQNEKFSELVLSPTQPFPVLPKSVAHNNLDLDDTYGLTPWDKSQCRKLMESLNYEGMYTPPSTDWTLMFTGNAGGINWGGLAIDQERQVLVVNASNLAFKVKLFPSADYSKLRKENPGKEISLQSGMPYGMWREMIMSPLGIPCNPTPWGTLTGIDLKTGKQLWQSTLGTTRDLAPVPIALNTGTPTLGGPLMTASGITFIGGTMDSYLRAFDNRSGEEVWKARLPAPANATPMSYEIRNNDGSQQQIVVVAAGGNSGSPIAMSDMLIAFALEDQ
jgi:quinoprotein glucose dehydrogenase